MKLFHHKIPEIYDEIFCNSEYRSKIIASINSREISRNMVRVKSSNIWSYTINVRNNDTVGDVYVQFKGDKGGPGDVYVYYDVPVSVYRRWHSASSKGHYFWLHIRGKYKFSKLTGDKKTKQRGGVDFDASRLEKQKEENTEEEAS